MELAWITFSSQYELYVTYNLYKREHILMARSSKTLNVKSQNSESPTPSPSFPASLGKGNSSGDSSNPAHERLRDVKYGN